MQKQNRGATYQRIIVAVDGSTISKRALQGAIRLTKELQAALLIVHVVDLVSFNIDTSADWNRYEESMRKSGERILKEAAAVAHDAGVDAETRLLEVQQVTDRIADEITREAKRWRADLIVAGTHGRRGLSHLFLGSVAESIVRISPKPILLMRGR